MRRLVGKAFGEVILQVFGKLIGEAFGLVGEEGVQEVIETRF